MARSLGNALSDFFSALPDEATVTGREVRRVLRAIDALHGTGNTHLPRIPIEAETNPNRFGAYGRTTGGQPVRIRIERNGDHQALTTAHEIGHFLDHQAFGTTPEFASELDSPVLVNWRQAVSASLAITALRQMASRKSIVVSQPDGDAFVHLVDSTYVDHLLRLRELWARSYAQYVATRSNDPVMRARLDRERVRKLGMPYYPEQWEDDDFAPIAEAFDELLKINGWRG